MELNAYKITRLPEYVLGVNYSDSDRLSLEDKLRDIQVREYGAKKAIYFIGQGLEMQALFPGQPFFKKVFADLHEGQKSFFLRKLLSAYFLRHFFCRKGKRGFFSPSTNKLFADDFIDNVHVNFGFEYEIEELKGDLYIVLSPIKVFTEDGLTYNPEFARGVHAKFLGNPKAQFKYLQYCNAFKKLTDFFGDIITIDCDNENVLTLSRCLSIDSGNIKSIAEPNVEFGSKKNHTFPAAGIKKYGPLDYNLSLTSKPSSIKVALIGTGFSRDLLNAMYKGDAKSAGFAGFKDVYKASLEVGDSRKITLTQEEIDVCTTVRDVASLLLRKALQIKHGAGLDVCVIELVPEWEHLFIGQGLDLRDYIKVCFWKERIPTQIITSKAIQADREKVFNNLALGIYVTAGGRPWRLEERIVNTAFIGITFGEVRGESSRLIGIAEIFDEYGESISMTSLALKTKESGGYFDDKDMHLSKKQFEFMLTSLLDEYKNRMDGNYPDKIVVHKTSSFDDHETAAIKSFSAHTIDFTLVYICSGHSNLWHLLTANMKEPQRGCYWKMADDRALIYTSGILQNQSTFFLPGIPTPMVLYKQNDSGASIDEICKQIMLLTKLNWNSTNSFEREPVTLSHARKIVDLLRAGLDPIDIPTDMRFFI